MAPEERKADVARAEPHRPSPVLPEQRPDARAGKPARTDAGTVMRLSADELVRLAPRLRAYLRTSAPAWPDIVDAAGWLRHDLGVSKSLWGEACLAMGREEAAIALAIVSAKPAGHFTSSPGGYFHAMVARAKAGTLQLGRTVWGLRTGGAANGAASGKRRDAGVRPVL